MSYNGHVENKLIVLDNNVELPEGTKVRVDVVEKTSDTPTRRGSLAKLEGILSQADFDMQDERTLRILRKHGSVH